MSAASSRPAARRCCTLWRTTCRAPTPCANLSRAKLLPKARPLIGCRLATIAVQERYQRPSPHGCLALTPRLPDYFTASCAGVTAENVAAQASYFLSDHRGHREGMGMRMNADQKGKRG